MSLKMLANGKGALTGILDLSRGYLAVYGAQRLGFSPEIQIFSGVAAVTGHNWSLFLKFTGGRGIGTFIGAFLALAPKLLGFSLLPLFIFGLNLECRHRHSFIFSHGNFSFNLL